MSTWMDNFFNWKKKGQVKKSQFQKLYTMIYTEKMHNTIQAKENMEQD